MNFFNDNQQEFPASFRVIGVGQGIEDVINKVNSFGFKGVSAEVVKYPFDCTQEMRTNLQSSVLLTVMTMLIE